MTPGARAPAAKTAANTAWLWANSACGYRPFDGACIYSYPAGKYLEWVEFYDGGGPMGNLCADHHGRIYSIESSDSSGFWILVYGGDGSGPRVIDDRPNAAPNACAVDPKTGDLAVANLARGKTIGNVAVFFRAQGEPKVYFAPHLFNYANCTYDDSGDLYVDGTDRSGAFRLVEHVAGMKGFKRITLDKSVRTAGTLQWDGNDLAIADERGTSILRVSIEGNTGHVLGVTLLRGPGGSAVRIGPFWLEGATIVASYGDRAGYPIGYWKYPQGGEPFKLIRHGENEYAGPRAVAIATEQ